MLDSTKLPLFLVAAFVLLITPGPAVLYIIARSMDQGRVAASLFGAVTAVWLGGVVTLGVVVMTALLAPQLRTLNLDAQQNLGEVST